MKLRTVMLVLLIFLMLSSAGSENSQSMKPMSIAGSEGISSENESHYPIIISNEEDFHHYGIPGSGTSEDPYVIENYNFYNTGIYVEDNIIFHGTEVIDYELVIRNCFFSSSGNAYGLVSIRSRIKVTIEGCTFIGGMEGIILDWVQQASIINNTIVNMDVGIDVSGLENAIIKDNSVYDCSTGMILSIDESSIINNKIYGNSEQGITIRDYSSNNTIQDNEIGWNGGYYELLGERNAEDLGADNNNTWNGNRWSDYSGFGPYEIRGFANSEDNQPELLVDLEAGAHA